MDSEATYQYNIAKFADYLRAGESSADGRLLGMELEHLVVDAGSLKTVSYYDWTDSDGSERPGVQRILERLVGTYGEGESVFDSDGNEHLVAIAHKGCPITVEPGAQIEVSIGAFESIEKIESAYSQFRAAIDPIIEEFGYELLTYGYRLKGCACQIPLLPKARYQMMDAYFHSTGAHGACMMRGSASTQVSIDYFSEADCMRKMRIASIIGPLLNMAMDNSPIFDGEPIGISGNDEKLTRSYLPVPRRMARNAIWDDVDADRSMVASFLFEGSPSYEGYAKMLMSRPPILTDDPGEDGIKRTVFHEDASAAEIYENREMDVADIEHVLSMFFFDVRLKQGYVEIRMADSVPIEYALAFVALIKGIFYNVECLEWLDEQLAGLGLADIALAKERLTADGYDAEVYGKPAAQWLDELVARASSALSSSDDAYLIPLAELIASRETLAQRYF